MNIIDDSIELDLVSLCKELNEVNSQIESLELKKVKLNEALMKTFEIKGMKEFKYGDFTFNKSAITKYEIKDEAYSYLANQGKLDLFTEVKITKTKIDSLVKSNQISPEDIQEIEPYISKIETPCIKRNKNYVK